MTVGKSRPVDAGQSGTSIDGARSGLFGGGRGSPEEPTADRESLVPDDVFEILRNARRRLAVQILADEGCPVALADLATAIAALENEKAVDDVAPEERKRVYISLYQCHVSKMDEAGIVEYDDESMDVALTPQGAELAASLRTFASGGSDATRAYPLVASVGFALSLLAFLGNVHALSALFLGIGLSFAAVTVTCRAATLNRPKWWPGE